MTKTKPQTRAAGRLILDRYETESSIGRAVYWYRLRCECGAAFDTTKSAVTRADRQRVKLFCAACQRRIRLEKLGQEYREKRQKPAVRGASLARPGEQLARKPKGNAPMLDAEATRAWRTLDANPARKVRVIEIMKPFIRAQRDAGLEPELSRIVIESVELAKREEATGVRADDRWTRENRWDGLQLVKYPIYDQPSPL